MEESFKVVCPLCKKEFEIEEEIKEFDINIECPYCNTDFVFGHEGQKWVSKMKRIYVILIGFLLLLVLDFLWLRVFSSNLYKNEIGGLMKSKINFISAFFVYALLFIGIFLFVLNNSYVDSVLLAAIFGGLFGLIVYGVYDLTNFAILKGYTLKITIIDMIWGTFLGSFMGAALKFFSLT